MSHHPDNALVERGTPLTDSTTQARISRRAGKQTERFCSAFQFSAVGPLPASVDKLSQGSVVSVRDAGAVFARKEQVRLSCLPRRRLPSGTWASNNAS